jgi:hypothetical protein
MPNDSIDTQNIESGVNDFHKSNRILKNPKIQKFIKRKPHIKKNVERAAEILMDEPKPFPAFKEAVRGILNDRIDVFFSYKSQDEQTAKKVVEQLRVFAGNKLRIIYAPDFRSDAGTNWNEKIRKGIKNAHWFILLLPDPSVDWDWCLFETGMFRGKMVSGKVNRLFCLHHPDLQPPTQIKEFQSIKAETDSVQSFLKMVYLDKDPIPGMDPINPYITPDLLEGISQTITKTISPPRPKLKRSHFERYVMLHIDDPGKLNCPGDLNQAVVCETDDLTLNIFGKRSIPKTFGKLIENVVDPECENRWLTELCDAIKKASTNTVFKPIQATFENYGRGKYYLPILYAMDERTDGTIENFKILLVEDVSATIHSKHIPKSIQALITSLRLAYRFRWEILERFEHKKLTTESVRQFTGILESIESEAGSRGVMDPENLCANFNATDSEKIMEFYAEWGELRNDRKTGILDRAIEAEDGQKIEEIMPTLADINHRFLNLAAARLRELS